MENSKVLLHKNFHYGIIYYRIAADVCGLCLRELDASSFLFYYGIYPVEGIGVFRVPKNGDARNKKPPALRVETKRCTKKSPFRYNRVVQALL